MNDLNTTLLEGRLVKDPELRTINNSLLCRFTIANARYFYDKDKNWVQDTSFLQVEVWGVAAKVCQEVLRKGRSVRIVGRIRQRVWKDNMEKYREAVCIIAEHIEFKPEKRNDSNVPESPTKMDSAMTERIRQEVFPAPENEGTMEDPIAYENETPEAQEAERTETQLSEEEKKEEKEVKQKKKEDEPF